MVDEPLVLDPMAGPLQRRLDHQEHEGLGRQFVGGDGTDGQQHGRALSGILFFCGSSPSNGGLVGMGPTFTGSGDPTECVPLPQELRPWAENGSSP